MNAATASQAEKTTTRFFRHRYENQKKRITKGRLKYPESSVMFWPTKRNAATASERGAMNWDTVGTMGSSRSAR